MTQQEQIYREALERVLATKPAYGMNPKAIVGSADALGWNVHAIARKALAATAAPAEQPKPVGYLLDDIDLAQVKRGEYVTIFPSGKHPVYLAAPNAQPPISMTDKEAHKIIGDMADHVDEWADSRDVDSTAEECSGKALRFLIAAIAAAIAAAPKETTK